MTRAEPAIVSVRRLENQEILEALADELGKRTQSWIGDRATVFVTGSIARGEATRHSDLDAFLVTTDASVDEATRRRFREDLTAAAEAAEAPLPELRDDRRYEHTLDELVAKMGTDAEDVENQLTTRLLLLLESRALVNPAVHAACVEKVVDRYFRVHPFHENDFLPIVLVNDIVRYWRLMLLAYEEKNSRGTIAPEERHLRSYKLRFSRCLLCYSVLLPLLAEARGKGRIERDFADALFRKQPLERLASLRLDLEREVDIVAIVAAMEQCYARFLELSDKPKAARLERFRDPSYARERSREATEFGNLVYRLALRLGLESPLFRYLVV